MAENASDYSYSYDARDCVYYRFLFDIEGHDHPGEYYAVVLPVPKPYAPPSEELYRNMSAAARNIVADRMPGKKATLIARGKLLTEDETRTMLEGLQRLYAHTITDA